MSYVIYRRTLTLAALLTLAFVAHAGTPAAPSNDLGQSWPRSQNVSSSAGWNVYVFTRDGVRYVQVNDTSGNVHAAFAVAGSQALVLPIGTDAQRVSISSRPFQDITSTAGETVYRDLQIQLTSVTQPDGLAWQVVTNSQPGTTSGLQTSALQSNHPTSCRECGSGIDATSQQATLQP